MGEDVEICGATPKTTLVGRFLSTIWLLFAHLAFRIWNLEVGFGPGGEGT